VSEIDESTRGTGRRGVGDSLRLEHPAVPSCTNTTVSNVARRRARVEIDMSAGELAVKSGAATLFEADFDFNIPA
jgi:hypothetical protein